MAPHASVVTDRYLSVLASSWLHALGPHLKAVVVPPYRWQHSHAIACTALAAFAVESLVVRLMHQSKWAGDSPIEFLYQLSGFPRRLARSADELFLLRNSLVHNHLWLMQGTWAGGVFTAEGIDRLRGLTQRRGRGGHL